MGQYYKTIIAIKKEEERELIALKPHEYDFGAKLTEFSFNGENNNATLASYVFPLIKYYQSKGYRISIITAGDYADPEFGTDTNLYDLCEDYELSSSKFQEMGLVPTQPYGVFYNINDASYFDYDADTKSNLDKLLMLTADGNGRGGGDYYGENKECVGAWSRAELVWYPDMEALKEEHPYMSSRHINYSNVNFIDC